MNKLTNYINTKIKKTFTSEESLNKLIKQTNEIEWANIYHDSIRGRTFLEQLPLNVGRWAGNYGFFYLLNRILHDYMPQRILDLGLGESSKFITAYLENHLLKSTHIVVEQNQDWIDAFNRNFKLSERAEIIHCPLKISQVNGHSSNCYDGFNEKIKGDFDLYIVDGPFGSDRYSRYDIVDLLNKNATTNSQFIILFDDSDRVGEKDTIKAILDLLREKQVPIYTATYAGNKSTTIIATETYRYCTSL